MNESRHYETPLSALGPIVRERVIVEGRTFIMQRPDESRGMLDHPSIKSAFEADEYLPYWTELWPASRMLAKAVLRETWPPQTEVLEVGCGLALPSIAALSKGYRVIMSDCDATALQFAVDNARTNGFQDFRTLLLDWRCPPPDLKVDVLLLSDLVYELRNINPLVNLIKQVLRPDGFVLLTDQDRLPAYNLREALDGEGFQYTARIMRAGQPDGDRVRGTLYRITFRSPPLTKGG